MCTHKESQAVSSVANGSIWAKQALTSDGWQSNVLVQFNGSGIITSVHSDEKATGPTTDVLLPAVANLHSHAFQRAMAGMTETRGSDPRDSFWSWRKLMYRFLNHLNPDDAEAIAAYGQMEMLESGYASVGEFHYLHHQPDGQAYSNQAEMSERIVAAAAQTGIGLTLLPVLYEQGGCDGRALSGGQKRFGHNMDSYAKLFAAAERCIQSIDHAKIGVAPHSLRAVSKDSLSAALTLAEGRPMHIHIAEQQAEVDELLSEYGARPVDWLLDNQPVNEQWCLIHATQMTASETTRLANTGAVVGLCPITESNLGDGIFDGQRYLEQAGRWGVGTDSNVQISLGQELRTLEYSQRLRDMRRVVYASPEKSNGRSLFEAAAQGGAQSLQRQSGCIGAGYAADLISIDSNSPGMVAVERDGMLDSWIFASDDSEIREVWVGGKKLVDNGVHIHREQLEARYIATMKQLAQAL